MSEFNEEVIRNFIMKKLIIIPILFFIILLSGCANNKPVSADLKSPAPSVNNSLPAETSFSPISNSQAGVEVTVENVKKEAGRTVIELDMNNHRYDLAAMDTKNRSSFSGVKPNEYIVKNSTMGGHHIQAEMVFAGELSGPLIISLDDSLIFNFNIQ